MAIFLNPGLVKKKKRGYFSANKSFTLCESLMGSTTGSRHVCVSPPTLTVHSLQCFSYLRTRSSNFSADHEKGVNSTNRSLPRLRFDEVALSVQTLRHLSWCPVDALPFSSPAKFPSMPLTLSGKTPKGSHHSMRGRPDELSGSLVPSHSGNHRSRESSPLRRSEKINSFWLFLRLICD